MAATKPPAEEPLEKLLARLEQIVEKLESGEVPLEKSIELYEEGRLLGAKCHGRLTQLEERVRLVVEKADGSLETRDFEDEDDSRAGD